MRHIIWVSILASGFASSVLAQANTFPTSGSVGIGTTNPTAKLEVAGDSSNNPVAISTNGGATSHVIVKRSGQATLNWGAYPGAYTSGLQIQNNDNSRFVWFSPLDAGSGTNAELRAAATGLNIYTGGTITDGGNLGFSQSASGNVGIGTSSPSDKLWVQGGGIAVDIPSAEGGRLRIINSAKSGAATIDWSIWNMTGGYGNGLSFWRYYGDGTNAGPSVWFGDNGNVGIGTTNPGERLDVIGRIRTNSGLVYNAGDGAPWWITGTANGPALLLQQHGGSGGPSSRRGALGWMDNSGLKSECLTWVDGGNVGIGTTNPTHKLSVSGTVRAKEVIVDTGWSDYVFKPDYILASLSEVEGAIKKDGHLPGIPSAHEVAEHGISVGEMQAKLLAKIEELTLHQIDQEKRGRAQDEEIARLRTEVARLSHKDLP